MTRATQSDMNPDIYPEVHPAIIENAAMAPISLRDSFVIPVISYEWARSTTNILNEAGVVHPSARVFASSLFKQLDDSGILKNIAH